METDYYKILGVEKNASDDELKKSFRKLAMMYHPDRQQGKSDEEKKKAETLFKQVNEAYSVLSDPQKRANYDRFGTADVNQGMGGAGFNPFEFFRQHMEGMGGFSGFPGFDDFPGFGFNHHNNTQEYNPNGPKNGSDVRIKANIPLEFALYGTTKEFNVKISDPCDHCNGTGSDDGKHNSCPYCGGSGMLTQRHGMMIMQSTCPHCHGSGQTISTPCHKCGGSGHVDNIRHIKVTIPQGIESGTEILIRGEGTKGVNGGSNGNLYVCFIISDNELFIRDGLNLATEIYISPVIASIGGTVEVPTPWGIAKLKIPPETPNKKSFRLSGKGVKASSGIGDMYVRINIETLQNITNEQKQLLEKLNSTITENNLKNSMILKKKYEEFKNNADKLKT